MADDFDERFFGGYRILLEEESMFGMYEVPTHAQQQQQQQNSDNEDNESEENVEVGAKHSREMTIHEKRQIVDVILLKMDGGNVPRGFKSHLGVQFGVHRSTITRLFQKIEQHLQLGEAIDVRSGKTGRCGRKPQEISDEFLLSVPLYKRTTERSYAAALNMHHSTLHYLRKKGRLRTHTSTNKPLLTEKHKVARMKWVLAHVNPAQPNENPKYVDMQHTIHIDEKWFFLNPETRRFYLVPSEEDPTRWQQSKNAKVKAMFMAMIGKPIFGPNGDCVHDGKYEIWPFVYKHTAQRRSKNRPAGTEETKAHPSINKDVIRRMLIDNILPAVLNKWPVGVSKNILIQWDNAKPHKIPNDDEFIGLTQLNGFNIQLIFQPAQSPDLNVLDLGLFRVIQSLQYQSFPETLDDLIDKVKKAFNEFDPVVNKYTWVTLQTCMTEILKVQGGNNYKVPHMGKRRLEGLGLLPEVLQVSQELIQQSVGYLNNLSSDLGQVFDEEDEMEVDAD